MQESQIPETNQPPIEPQIPQRNLHPRVWISVLVVIVAAGSYLAYTSINNNAPTSPPASPDSSRGGQPSPYQGEREGRGLEEDDELAGWQTYRNEEYGFEVRYPEDWDYRYVELYDKGENYIFELSTDRENNYFVVAPATGYPADPGFNDALETHNTKVDGVDAVEYVWSTLILVNINYPPDNWASDVGHIYFYSKDSKANQIFSTFKFIEP